MKRKILNLVAFVAIAAGMMMTSSCKPDEPTTAELLLGTWKLTNITEGSVSRTPAELGSTMFYFFKDDGTYSAHYTLEFYGELYQQDENGTYTLDDKTITLTYTEDGETFVEQKVIQEIDETHMVTDETITNDALGEIHSIRTYEKTDATI